MPYTFIGRGLEPRDWLSLACVAVSFAVSVGIAALSMEPVEWLAWALVTPVVGGLVIYGFSGE